MSKKGRKARQAVREAVKASEREAFSLQIPAVAEPKAIIPRPAIEAERPAHPLSGVALAALARFGSLEVADLAAVLRGSEPPTPDERKAYRLVATDTLSELFTRGVVRKDSKGRYHPTVG